MVEETLNPLGRVLCADLLRDRVRPGVIVRQGFRRGCRERFENVCFLFTKMALVSVN